MHMMNGYKKQNTKQKKHEMNWSEGIFHIEKWMGKLLVNAMPHKWIISILLERAQNFSFVYWS